MIAKPRAAAIYARISSDPEHDQLGVTRQLQDCRSLAERCGWQIADEYVDNDISAWGGRPRPQYRRLLTDISAGLVDAVVVWHTDRLHRHPKELEEYIDVCQPSGVPTVSCAAGELDLASPDGLMVARMLGAAARYESDNKSRRIRRKHEELAQAGRMNSGGGRPFGYLADRITLDPDEAPIVREAAERILAGDSLRSVCVDFNRRGIRTVTGRDWYVHGLRRMLLSARISGQREHHHEIVATGDCQPIITPEQTARLRALLTDPARRTNRTPRKYLLTGLLQCRVCASKLVARPRGDGARRYICAKGPGSPGCGSIAILADTLERFIVQAILHRLDSPALAAGLAGAGADGEAATTAHAQAEAAAQDLQQLAAAWGAQQISWPEFLAARKPIEARVDAAKRALTRLSRVSAVESYVGDSATLRERWDDLPLARQRAIVAALLDRAIVDRALVGRNTFDPSRVDPVWRV